jgi:thiamine-phosphate pyrophosphorylase
LLKAAGKLPIERIIDANLNRLKEGLRVCEEVARFILEDGSLTSEIKRIRHSIDSALTFINKDKRLIRYRNIEEDIGKKTTGSELRRKDITDVFFANIQRAKESTRVIEEFSKITDKGTSLKFKKIRYAIYSFEKKTAKKLIALCGH